jgi:uncharacterized protein YbjT (DUF2867 family)
MILVVGGGSKIGSALLGILSGQGAGVRALVRSEHEGNRLPAVAQAVPGNLADFDSLAASMAGTEKVFLLSSPHPDAVARETATCAGGWAFRPVTREKD